MKCDIQVCFPNKQWSKEAQIIITVAKNELEYALFFEKIRKIFTGQRFIDTDKIKPEDFLEPHANKPRKKPVLIMKFRHCMLDFDSCLSHFKKVLRENDL